MKEWYSIHTIMIVRMCLYVSKQGSVERSGPLQAAHLGYHLHQSIDVRPGQ